MSAKNKPAKILNLLGRLSTPMALPSPPVSRPQGGKRGGKR